MLVAIQIMIEMNLIEFENKRGSKFFFYLINILAEFQASIDFFMVPVPSWPDKFSVSRAFLSLVLSKRPIHLLCS
jgi:hypothetical protein